MNIPTNEPSTMDQRRTMVYRASPMTERSYFSDAETAAFGRDGFVVVRGLYDAAAMADIAAWTDDIQARPETPGKWMKYFDDSLTAPGIRILNRVENFCPYHDGFDELMRRGEMPARIGELFGGAAVLFKEKINYKLPGGDGFAAHQDVQAGWDTYAARHITALISIDAATARPPTRWRDHGYRPSRRPRWPSGRARAFAPWHTRPPTA